MRLRTRNEIAGATYHVFARGVDRRRIFVDEEDYQTYTRLLEAVVYRQGWHLFCYCLMPNHVHLLLETPKTNLGNGMQWLHGRYARAFNERHRRTGHLFEAPYNSPLITTDEKFVRAVGYVVVNPVAAALCGRAAEWRWSSHAMVERSSGPPGWVAHRELIDRLEALTGSRCYAELIEAWERY